MRNAKLFNEDEPAATITFLRKIIPQKLFPQNVRLDTLDHLLLDSAPNIGPLISCWELDKFKNC
jgi:hypothetical protein